MPTIFTATYLVDRNRQRPSNVGPVAQAFFAASATPGPSFPYDGGDDPAFFCAGHYKGPVTWGVCRTDVRRLAKPGDWAVFFSAESPDGGAALHEYRFVAALRVASKVKGWNLEPPFDQYLNRLVEPDPEPGYFKHYEGATVSREWHKDWLWRLTHGRTMRKQDHVNVGKAGRISESWLVDQNGASSYVIFDQPDLAAAVDSGTFGLIRKSPPMVACRLRNEQTETWFNTLEVLALREAIFGDRTGHYLRTSNPFQPHRHTRRVVADGDAWFSGVQAASGAVA